MVKAPLFIKQTRNTPGVLLDPEQNLFEFRGRSLPEHAVSFYEPIITWLKDYASKPESETTVTFKLDYFNTPSAKPLLQILRLIDAISSKGHTTKMFWYHRNDDVEMKEVGEEFSRFIRTPLYLVSY